MLDKNSWLTGSIFADPDHFPIVMVKHHLVEKYRVRNLKFVTYLKLPHVKILIK